MKRGMILAALALSLTGCEPINAKYPSDNLPPNESPDMVNIVSEGSARGE